MALVVNWSDSPLSIYKVVFRRPLSHNHTYKHRSKVAQILNLFSDFVSWQHGKIIVKQVTFQLLSGRNYNNKKKRVAVPKVLYETNNFARNIIFLSLPCDRQLDQSCKKMKRLSQPLFHNFVNGKKEKKHIHTAHQSCGHFTSEITQCRTDYKTNLFNSKTCCHSAC